MTLYNIVSNKGICLIRSVKAQEVVISYITYLTQGVEEIQEVREVWGVLYRKEYLLDKTQTTHVQDPDGGPGGYIFFIIYLFFFYFFI